MSEGAAPSTGAAPAPTATGTEPTQGQQAQETQPQARPIKPIPPKVQVVSQNDLDDAEITVSPDGEAIPKGYKPHLPGVFTNDTGSDLIPQVKRQRDPVTGKFLSGSRPELPEGVEAGPVEGDGEASRPDLPAGETPPPAKVKFLGKEYNSLADVEQVHRTLQGVHRQQLEERRKLSEERDYGYQSGNAWKAKYDELVAQVHGGQTPGQNAQPAASQRQPVASPAASGVDFNVEEAMSDIDMNAFEMIASHPRGGLPNAGKYLVAETLRVVTEKLVPSIMAQMNRRLEPVETTEQSRAAQEHQLGQFEMVAGMMTMDGDVAFPELGDAGVLEEIGELWGRAHRDDPERAQLRNAQDIIQALSLYRTMKGFVRRPQSQSIPAGDLPLVPQPAPGAAASLEAEPQGLTPSNGGRATGSPQDRRLIAALDKVELVDPILGFRRNA